MGDSLRIPTNDYGDSCVDLEIIQRKSNGDYDGKVKLAAGSMNKDGHKTFYALFTKEETDFSIKVTNRSDTRVKYELQCFVS